MKFWLFDPNNKDNKFAYINALAGLQNIKVISAPQLQVLSNHTATMSVGEQVPIIT